MLIPWAFSHILICLKSAVWQRAQPKQNVLCTFTTFMNLQLHLSPPKHGNSSLSAICHWSCRKSIKCLDNSTLEWQFKLVIFFFVSATISDKRIWIIEKPDCIHKKIKILSWKLQTAKLSVSVRRWYKSSSKINFSTCSLQKCYAECNEVTGTEALFS